MELHPDVVVDLLPAYLAGEASAETRRLVERCLAADPALARLAEDGRRTLAAVKPPPNLNKEPMTMELENLKRLALYRTLGLSVLFSGLFVVLKGEGEFKSIADAASAGAVTINYGVFINNIISFLIVAFAVFLLIKGINKLKREEKAAPAEPPPTPEDVLLLREIRDSLKK